MKVSVMHILLFVVITTGCKHVSQSDTEVYTSESKKGKNIKIEDTIEIEEETEDVVFDTIATEVPPETKENKLYFKATGNEPFWNLQITDEGILFNTLDEVFEDFHAPFQYPIVSGKEKKYELETPSGQMNITILQQHCDDTMADASFAYAVTVEVLPLEDEFFTHFSGCGAYTMDSRLEAFWVLEKLGDMKIDLSKFEINVPHLEIHTASNTFTGFAGCNHIKGNLFSEVELLLFTDLKSPKKICSQANKEDLFLEALKKATSYNVTDSVLQLKNPTRVLMHFKKAAN